MGSETLRERMLSHAEKVKKQEEMEAMLAGVFSQEAEMARERFADLAMSTIKPAFDDFKANLREMGRDAVVVLNLCHTPVQSIGLTLLDRYLSFGIGKTLRLVNPKEDLAKGPNTKFYEIYRGEDAVYVRQRVDTAISPIVTEVPVESINPIFLENELAAFFERAYPAGTEPVL
jgi:hypothetical protein